MVTGQVKIGRAGYDQLSRFSRRMGISRAEVTRRALDMYLAVIGHPAFWRAVQKLNGRRLADVIVELLVLWVEEKVVLDSDRSNHQ